VPIKNPAGLGSGPLCRPEHRSGTRTRPRECLSEATCARPRGPAAREKRRAPEGGGSGAAFLLVTFPWPGKEK